MLRSGVVIQPVKAARSLLHLLSHVNEILTIELWQCVLQRSVCCFSSSFRLRIVSLSPITNDFRAYVGFGIIGWWTFSRRSSSIDVNSETLNNPIYLERINSLQSSSFAMCSVTNLQLLQRDFEALVMFDNLDRYQTIFTNVDK
jgi:hypothetical protein